LLSECDEVSDKLTNVRNYFRFCKKTQSTDNVLDAADCTRSDTSLLLPAKLISPSSKLLSPSADQMLSAYCNQSTSNESIENKTNDSLDSNVAIKNTNTLPARPIRPQRPLCKSVNTKRGTGNKIEKAGKEFHFVPNIDESQIELTGALSPDCNRFASTSKLNRPPLTPPNLHRSKFDKAATKTKAMSPVSKVIELLTILNRDAPAIIDGSREQTAQLHGRRKDSVEKIREPTKNKEHLQRFEFIEPLKYNSLSTRRSYYSMQPKSATIRLTPVEGSLDQILNRPLPAPPSPCTNPIYDEWSLSCTSPLTSVSHHTHTSAGRPCNLKRDRLESIKETPSLNSVVDISLPMSLSVSMF